MQIPAIFPLGTRDFSAQSAPSSGLSAAKPASAAADNCWSFSIQRPAGSSIVTIASLLIISLVPFTSNKPLQYAITV